MLNHDYIGTEHLLLGLIHEGEGIAAKSLESLGISLEVVREKVEEIVDRGAERPEGHIPFTPRAKKVLELTLREALQLGHNYIGTEHVLLGLIREGEGVAAQVLMDLGAELPLVRQEVIQLLGQLPPQQTHGGLSTEQPEEDDIGQTSTDLGGFAPNLTEAARAGRLAPAIGRDKEIERVMQVLCRRAKNYPVLIGEHGIRKSAIVEGLAQAIARDEVPEILRGRAIYRLDAGLLEAGGERDDLAERLKRFVEEIDTLGDMILFIDELHTLVGAGVAEDVIDAASILKLRLTRGRMQIIGSDNVRPVPQVHRTGPRHRKALPTYLGE